MFSQRKRVKLICRIKCQLLLVSDYVYCYKFLIWFLFEFFHVHTFSNKGKLNSKRGFRLCSFLCVSVFMSKV